MNQGQNGQDNTQPFFTPGQGNDSADINRFEAENNLDLTNPSASWQPAREKAPDQIGNAAINAPDLPNNNQENLSPIQTEANTENTLNNVGPNNITPANETAQAAQNQPQENIKPEEVATEEYHIQSVGDSLDKETMHEVQKKITEFKKGDIENGYDKIADFREEYYKKLMEKPAA